MTRGAWMRRQHDEGLKYWFAPRENEKPFTESERAQRWRLSLASLLFITVLLSDHLWFCAEAKLTRTRDKRSDEGLAITDMGEYPNSLHRHHTPTSPDPYRLAREQYVIFLGNSTKSLWRMDACHPDSLSKDCFTFTDAETVCLGLSGGGEKGTQLAYVNLSDLYLSFCNSYSLLDLFYGFTSPVVLNCTLDMAMGVDLLGCSECVRAYQRLDLEAEENYREFELLVQKYETDAYSVRTCMEECKMVYKPWLCSQYFQTTQMHCSKPIPCGQYCLEVQQRCPFILPDNDDLIHGGSPSFICTGLLEDYPSGVDPDAECCDVRWDLKVDNRSRGTLKRTHPPCQHRTSLSSSAACRLCNSRLKLCLLVLVLLHTVASLTASHNATGLGLPAITPLEESPANEE
ncbi:transmembrane protein FAM155A [Seriola lalandi dorsalis]|uniref:NALCN channel auxiliary factor 1 n=2 Tax=Seriola TaxID=8160 RepID=A0A3B4TL17_SERDU|nr:transmembrane protein FAM155A-like [Seriola dumerili]XP_023271729.1 transmembrane protein FAM155A [Seriola lalandi dorsalis]XP_056245201.1 NALCN channel auxiliary factor 1 isoform X2 [Seriola aureovittata]